MSSGPDEPPPDASELGSDGRLDSWKEIAAYLRRSVRSARRWEKEERLPVRRHVHRKGDSVYAYKTELDAWWHERGANLGNLNGAVEPALSLVDPPPPDLQPGLELSEPVRGSTPPIPQRSKRVAWIVAGFAAAVLVVGVTAWLSRNGSGLPAGSLRPLPFQSRDWVLVTSFENRTGEKLFDGTLDYALARELSNSRYINVVPRERIGDALRLMQKPIDTRVDAALGREVCLRDGGIRALLTGRVEKLASKYVLSVEIVEPKQGTALAGFSEETTGVDGSLAAVQRISDRVRVALRETPSLEVRDRPLVKVTTANMRALQLYSQADSLMASGGNQAAAEELLRQAVANDPNFASAYIHLAHAIRNQGRPPEDYRAYLETAFRLSDTTTERERFFIRGSYYQLLGQREKAIAAYEALLSLYPDHDWATGNLDRLYDPWKQPERGKVLELEIRLADLRPKTLNTNFHAAYNSIRLMGQRARGQPYLRRARALITPEVTRESPIAAAWIELWPFTEHWLEGDLEAASRELDRFAATLDSFTGVARDHLAVPVALSYLTLGKIETADRISRTIVDPLASQATLAQVAFVKTDASALKSHLDFLGTRKPDLRCDRWSTTTPVLQARAGLLPAARRFLQAMERRPRPSYGAHETIRGEIALAGGNLDAAIRELEEATRWPQDEQACPYFFLGSESLAAALGKKGDTRRAMEVLERASERKFLAVASLDPTVPYWMRNRLELAKVYRSVGRAGDALPIEADLLKLLALADADHPMLVELRQLAKS